MVSTVNPSVPVTNAALSSAAVRAGISAAAASDINNLQAMFAGSSAPAAPYAGQLWLNTSATPYVASQFDGTTWVPVWTLNASTHEFETPGTVTNDNATAGNVGEHISCSGPDTSSTVTITIATPAVVTWTAHGLTLGAPVTFTTTGALPTGLTAGTPYYAVPINANTFNVATSVANALAGTLVATSGTQSGTQTATSAVTLATGTPADITGILLTAGDWDVDALVTFTGGTTTTVTKVQASISLTAGTLDASTMRLAQQPCYGLAPFNFGGVAMCVGTTRVTVANAATQIVHLVAESTFGTSTAAAYGGIRARRVR